LGVGGSSQFTSTPQHYINFQSGSVPSQFTTPYQNYPTSAAPFSFSPQYYSSLQSQENFSPYSTPQTFRMSFTTENIEDSGDEDRANENEVAARRGEAMRGNKTEKRPFTKEEDKVLLHAYLELSENEKTGNNQKETKFWGDVMKLYEETRKFRENNSQFMGSERLQARESTEQF